MKRLLKLLAIVVIATAIIFGFTACGGGDSNENGGSNLCREGHTVTVPSENALQDEITAHITALETYNCTDKTVSVTGQTSTGPLVTITIPEGITVKWEAVYTSPYTFSDYGVINLYGAGSFEVAKDAHITSTNSYLSTIKNHLTGRLTVYGTVEAQGQGSTAISNNLNGTLQVSGGLVKKSGLAGTAIVNTSNGTVIIDRPEGVPSGGLVGGGTVLTENNSWAIANQSLGTVTLSDGNVSSLGTAIYNAGAGTINVINAGNITNSMYPYTPSSDSVGILNNSNGNINITGGNITLMKGTAIKNNSTGIINISGGKVASYEGAAIYNNSNGVINISQNAAVETHIYSYYFQSSSPNPYTIVLNDGTMNMTGGLVEMDAYNNGSNIFSLPYPAVIYSLTSGSISISGGKIYLNNSHLAGGGVLYGTNSQPINLVAIRHTGTGILNTVGAEIIPPLD